MMTLLQITSPDGNTTEEHFSPAEMAEWFSRGERAELELTGKLRQLVGLRGVRLIKVLPSAAPASTNTASRIGGLYYLMVTEKGGAEYVTRYGEAEMDEVFNASQRRDLAKGGTLTIGRCRYVDMVAAARTLRDWVDTAGPRRGLATVAGRPGWSVAAERSARARAAQLKVTGTPGGPGNRKPFGGIAGAQVPLVLRG